MEEAPKSRIERARDIIFNSRQAVEDEFSSTANDWLSCFGSKIFQLECNLSTDKAKEELGSETFDKINDKLENLKTRLEKLKTEYPDKDIQPPEDIKEELFRSLDIIG